jgi:hypothetical protein
MTEERKITYGDIMNLEKKLLDAPELPRDEQSVKDKKEALSLLRKEILAYLKKGYSIQAVVETINRWMIASFARLRTFVASLKPVYVGQAKPIACIPLS